MKRLLSFGVILASMLLSGLSLSSALAGDYQIKHPAIIPAAISTTSSSSYKLTNCIVGDIYGGRIQNSSYLLKAGCFYIFLAKKDSIPPTITIVQPPTPTNQDVVLSYTVSDNISPSDKITVTGDSSPYTQQENYSVILTATDEAGNSTTSVLINFTIDKTPPSAVTVTDDGENTTNKTQLYASWTESSDATSGIKEYQYAIGTSAGTTNIVDWTSAGLNTEITHSGFSLTHGPLYYISVRAIDNAGNISEATSSDGISNGYPPEITDIKFTSGQNFHQGWPLVIQVDAADLDGDSIEYRYLINGNEVQTWALQSSISWNPTTDDIGLNNIKIEVRAPHETSPPKEKQLYLFRKPIRPTE